MPKFEATYSKKMPSRQVVWEYISDFGSDWHPDILHSSIEYDVNGAEVRGFEGSDGGNYCEQITYLSHSDHKLCYSLLSGISGVKDYRGQVEFTEKNEATWSATFEANDDIGNSIAEGTEEIFKNGLDWLAENRVSSNRQLPALDHANRNIQLHRVNIEGSPDLSVLTTIQPEQKCWTLVLFLHGIGGNSTNWDTQLQYFGERYSVAALDLRGYGGSKLGQQQTRIDDCCEDILRVMKHFGARRLVLVGISMGSWIATSFAMRHQRLLAGLVLAGGCTGMSEASTMERRSFEDSRLAPLSRGQSPADFASDVVKIISGPNATEANNQALHASMAEIGAATYKDALTCFCNPVEKFDFSRLTFPILLMTGEFDKLAPPDEIRHLSRRIFDDIHAAQQLPDIRFEVIENAGHVCNLEQPENFNQQLAAFLKRMPNAKITKPSSRSAKRHAKSQRILDAALAEFSTLGFDGVSMSAIAERAGVSKPTLYQYFGDKDGLFAAVLQECCTHLVTPLASPEGSLVDRLWNFSWNYAEFVLRPDMLSLARLVLGEAARKPEVAEAYHNAGPGEAFKGLTSFVLECEASRQLSVDDAEFAAQDLWSLILSGPRDHFLHFAKERPDPQQLLRSIAHGLQIFLTIYSSNKDADLKELQMKIDNFHRAQNGIRGTIND